MKVRFSPRARRRVRIVADWWRKNGSIANLFDEELAEVVERLKVQPGLGATYATVVGEVIRRVLLPKSEQHVYYAVDDTNGLIIIYAVWGARRGRGPKL